MSLADKLISGVLITILLSLGGIVYKTQTDRIGVLEANAMTIQAQAVRDQVTLAEIRLEQRYTRQSVERMEVMLNTLITPRFSLPDHLTPKVPFKLPPPPPLQGP